VLDASVSSIVVLLSKEVGKLILVAFVLSAPVAWFAVNWWLKSYTCKVDVGIFFGAGWSAFFIWLHG
jgi:putative ABC transport system permease protein